MFYGRKFLKVFQPYGRKITEAAHHYGRKIEHHAHHVGSLLKGAGFEGAGHTVSKHVGNTASNIASAAKHLDENNVHQAINSIQGGHRAQQLADAVNGTQYSARVGFA